MLKEIVNLQDVIKKDDLNYRSKGGKTYNFAKYSVPFVFLKDIHQGYFWSDLKQSNFAIELKDFGKATKTLEKNSSLINLRLVFSAKEKVPNSFESKLFPIKHLNKIPTSALTPEKAAEAAVESTPNQTNTNYGWRERCK